jgi:hypothetical protein
MKGRQVNVELGSMWKEAVVAKKDTFPEFARSD